MFVKRSFPLFSVSRRSNNKTTFQGFLRRVRRDNWADTYKICRWKICFSYFMMLNGILFELEFLFKNNFWFRYYDIICSIEFWFTESTLALKLVNIVIVSAYALSLIILLGIWMSSIFASLTENLDIRFSLAFAPKKSRELFTESTLNNKTISQGVFEWFEETLELTPTTSADRVSEKISWFCYSMIL